MANEGSVTPSGHVGVWHYYAAVGNKDAKLTTLVELLQALQATSRRPLAICCGARDSLDSLVYALLRSRAFGVTAIHSDLTDKERELALAGFKRGLAGTTQAAAAAGGTASVAPESPGTGAAAAGERQLPSEAEAVGAAGRGPPLSGGSGPGLGSGSAVQEELGSVLVVTDVCLKALPKDLLPLGISLLVEYDLPPTKEAYTRRVNALFGSGKDRRSQRCVVIDMVEAGAIGAFRSLEGFAVSAVQEMPVRVEDIFAAA